MSSASACPVCAAGTYSSTVGAQSCASCPSGKYGVVRNATTVLACPPCGAGTYGLGPGLVGYNASCGACPPGTFSSALGVPSASQCNECPAGTYRATPGSTSRDGCALCPAGTYSNLTRATSLSACVACPSGTASDSLGGASVYACVSCSRGTRGHDLLDAACGVLEVAPAAYVPLSLGPTNCSTFVASSARADRGDATGVTAVFVDAAVPGALRTAAVWASGELVPVGRHFPALPTGSSTAPGGGRVSAMCALGSRGVLIAARGELLLALFDAANGSYGPPVPLTAVAVPPTVCTAAAAAVLAAATALDCATSEMRDPTMTAATLAYVVVGSAPGVSAAAASSNSLAQFVLITLSITPSGGAATGSTTVIASCVPLSLPPALVAAPGLGSAVAILRPLPAAAGMVAVAIAEPAAGVVRVVTFNATDGSPTMVGSVFNAVVGSAAGAAAAGSGGGTLFGVSLAAMGDLDGDGVGDLLVGAPGAHAGAGAAYVVKLTAAGNATATAEVATAPLSSCATGFGAGVARMGDLNGDGVVDIAVACGGGGGGGTAVAVLLICASCMRVVARDSASLPAPGISPTDTVLVQFPCNVVAQPWGMVLDAGVRALVTFSAPLGPCSGIWQTQSALQIELLDVRGASLAATRIGVLTATLLLPAACGTGSAVITLPVSGSWGRHPAPHIVAAVARDFGEKPGYGPGDAIVFQFDQSVTLGGSSLDTVSAVDALLTWSAQLGEYRGALSADAGTLVVSIVDTAGAADVNATRVGLLRVGVRAVAAAAAAAGSAGVIRSADESSPPCNDTGVLLSGSWGNFSVPAVTSAQVDNSGGQDGMGPGDTVTVHINMPTNTPPIATAVQLTLALQFAGELGPTARGTWHSPSIAVVYLGATAAASDPGATRIGVLTVRGGPALRARDLSSPPVPGPATLVTGSWGNNIVSIAPLRLATTGSELVLLQLGAPLGGGGPNNLNVTAAYSNGVRTYTATQCAVDASAGAYVQCLSAPGVGVGYTWLVSVGVLGAAGPPGLVMTTAATPALTVSYAPPLIVGVSVAGSAAVVSDGGQLVTVSGVGFGPEADAVSDVSCHDKSDPSKVWYPHGCHVVSQTAVVCTTPAMMGASMVFSLRIAGQPTADVALQMAPPRIDNVTCRTCGADDGRGGGYLSSAGGDAIVITGGNLGPFIMNTSSGPSHVLQYAPRGAAASAAFVVVTCAVSVPHHQLTCAAAPGCGTALGWRVTVMGVTSGLYTSVLAYGAPRLSAIATAAPVATAGGATMSLRGVNFGAACASSVAAAAFGVHAVALLDGASATVPLAVTSDTTATVTLPAGVGAVHDLRVSTGAAGTSGALPWAYAPPSVTSVGPINNMAGVWNVAIAGRNFGTTIASVNVTIGSGGGGSSSAPCNVTSLLDDAIVCHTLADGGAVVVCAGDQCSAPGAFAVFDPRLVLEPSVLTSPDRDATLGAPLSGGGLAHLRGSALIAAAPRVGVIMAWRHGVSSPWVDATDCPIAVALANTSAASARSDLCARVTWVSSIQVDCALRPSETGVAWVAIVNVIGDACVASAPIVVLYNPPVVAAVTPRVLDTGGGEPLAVSGTDFPRGTNVSIGGRPCMSVVRVNSTLLYVSSPRGEGASVTIVLTAPVFGAVPQGGLALAYAPPIIDRVDAVPGPCSGGGYLTLRGANFGLSPLVTVDGASATHINVSADGRVVVAAAPPGSGGGRPVAITVGHQTAVGVPAKGCVYNYAPPVVLGLTVSAGAAARRHYVDAALGGTVAFSGVNFVPTALNVSSLSVTIGGVPCTAPSRQSDTQLSCVASPSRVDAAAVVIVSVSGLTGAGTVRVACPPGYWGLQAGDVCLVCPSGATCYGGDFPPLPVAGYASADGGFTSFVACVPPESCAGIDEGTYLARVSAAAAAAGSGAGGPAALGAAPVNCNPGYTAAQCRSCATDYYRNGVVCVPCPRLATLYIVLFLVFLVLVGALAGWLNRKQYNMKGASDQ
jgi:hypothetical protein